MKQRYERVPVALLITVLSVQILFAQTKQEDSKSLFLVQSLSTRGGQQKQKGGQAYGYREIFLEIEHAVATGNLLTISRHFSLPIYMHLRGEEPGYYSANQGFYLLERFFSLRYPLGFTFTTIGESGSQPFATGSGSFNRKGTREHFQVYVSLDRLEKKWVITQFNVY